MMHRPMLVGVMAIIDVLNVDHQRSIQEGICFQRLLSQRVHDSDTSSL
jgi:hypothetical protein